MTESQPPSSPPESASVRSAVMELASGVYRVAKASEGLLEGIDELRGSIKGIHSELSKGFAAESSEKAAMTQAFQKLQEDMRANTKSVEQFAEFVRELIKRQKEDSQRIEALESHLLMGGNGNG